MSTQLYIMAPLFFLALFRFPKYGIALILVTLGISPLLTALPRIMTGYPSYVEVTKWTDLSNITKAITHYHMNPALYVTALMIGMAVWVWIHQLFINHSFIIQEC